MLPTLEDLREEQRAARRQLVELAAAMAIGFGLGWLITEIFTAINAVRVAADMAGRL